jgi:hypothetical protein
MDLRRWLAVGLPLGLFTIAMVAVRHQLVTLHAADRCPSFAAAARAPFPRAQGVKRLFHGFVERES